jgi:ATP-dependent DNA helicase RecG
MAGRWERRSGRESAPLYPEKVTSRGPPRRDTFLMSMDAHSRRVAALRAIEQILQGARPEHFESDLLDFKEERGTTDVAGGHVSIPPRHEPAARALAEEAACFANSQHGGVIVVGVNDKQAGPAAFTGSYLDTAWLRQRLYALTQPHLAVDEIEVQEVQGKRIYLINVAPALEEIRCDGKLRARFADGCRELSGDQARALLEQRRHYDWSAEPSGLRFSQVEPQALALARRYYAEARGRGAASDRALASQLGLFAGDAQEPDPELNRAGALLLAVFEPHVQQLDVLVAPVEGARSRKRLERAAPLLPAFADAWELLDAEFPSETVVIAGRRRAVRSIPEDALREALVNAIMHRDYRLPRGRIVVQVLGQPAATLKVRSPGDFPPGVRPERILTTPSTPRNPVLAHAVHLLGLAEREGIGIDTMYLQMLRDGHPVPEITEDGGDVLCVLSGGRVDREVRAFFDRLAEAGAELRENVRAYIAITALLLTTPLRVDALAELAQCTRDEALQTLEQLRAAGAVETLVHRGSSYRLTPNARDQLRTRLQYSTLRPLDAHWEMIRASLDTVPEIGRDDVAALLGVTPVQASRILSQLFRERGVIVPVGNVRGRGVRYRLPAGRT